MGLGIAYVASTRARLPVLIFDKSKVQIERSLALMDRLLSKDVTKGKLGADEAKEARERITIVDGTKAFRDVDLCVEVDVLSNEIAYLLILTWLFRQWRSPFH